MATKEVTAYKPETPYKLDLTQTTQACKVLLKQITEEQIKREQQSGKPNLLAQDNDEDDNEASETADAPVWMIMTTKKHIVDQKRLKPSKLSLPHPFNTSPTSTICLITADPASTFREAIDQSNFPAELRSRITRIIPVSKIKTDFKTFEARRKLFAEHDIFLADDRVVTFLPKLLGKAFYKGGIKRPVPVSIGAPRARGEDGKRIPLDPAQQRKGAGVEGGRGAASVEVIAREVERALGSALIHLAPGTTTSVRVGRAGMSAEDISANIEAVVAGLTEKFVTKGWKNVRAIHIKGTATVALPVWLASELWVEDGDVHEQKKTFGKKPKPLEAAANQDKKLLTASPDNASKKRKADVAVKVEKTDADKHAKKKRKADAQEKLSAELALRKAKLKQQKKEAMTSLTA